MTKKTYVQLVPTQLKEGVGEPALLQASDAFQAHFVSKQRGVQKRVLLRGKHGGYADLVFFDSQEDAERIAAAEATSEHCLALFDLLKPPDPSLPDMGILSFEHLKTYE